MMDNVSILIIDDEENLRWTLAMILKRQGYAVSTAASVREAQQRLQEATYNLALLDLKLPETSGLDFLPEIRRKYPDMPVLILTAHDKLESAADAVHNGASDYLLKPIDPELIIQRVKEVLAEHDQPLQKRKRYTQLKKLLRDQKLEGSPETQPPRDPDD